MLHVSETLWELVDAKQFMCVMEWSKDTIKIIAHVLLTVKQVIIFKHWYNHRRLLKTHSRWRSPTSRYMHQHKTVEAAPLAPYSQASHKNKFTRISWAEIEKMPNT